MLTVTLTVKLNYREDEEVVEEDRSTRFNWPGYVSVDPEEPPEEGPASSRRAMLAALIDMQDIVDEGQGHALTCILAENIDDPERFAAALANDLALFLLRRHTGPDSYVARSWALLEEANMAVSMTCDAGVERSASFNMFAEGLRQGWLSFSLEQP